jgi:hypothetical protein
MLRNSHSPTPDESRINSTLQEYNVSSEEEYELFVNETWDKVFCARCRKPISLLHCHFDHGDPIHANPEDCR